jgi:hypothetical protein
MKNVSGTFWLKERANYKCFGEKMAQTRGKEICTSNSFCHCILFSMYQIKINVSTLNPFSTPLLLTTTFCPKHGITEIFN